MRESPWQRSRGDGEREAVAALVRQHVAGNAHMSIPPHSGVVVARDQEGTVVGGLVCNVVETGTPMMVMHLRDVVVEPEWRSHGIASVLVLVRDQLLNRPSIGFGGCAPELAQFYSRCGFTVLRPGAIFPLGVLFDQPESFSANGNVHHPCWFFSDSSAAGRIAAGARPGISQRTAEARRRRKR